MHKGSAVRSGSPSLATRLRRFMGFAVEIAGITALAEKRRRPGVTILYAHRIGDDELGFFGACPVSWFESALERLARRYKFLALGDLVDRLLAGRDLPEGGVVLTFDDGFRDNYELAYPVLRRSGFPATIFLAAECVDSGSLPWPQQVGWAFERTRLPEVTLRCVGPRRIPTGTRVERQAGHIAVERALRPLGRLAREAALHELADATGVEPPRDRMLTWNQIANMRRGGITFGAHTLTHPLLAQIPRQEALHEISASKQLIEQRLGEPVRHFAFPGGSYDSELVQAVRAAGFQSAFVKAPGSPVNLAGADPFALCRVGLSHDPPSVVAAEIAGVFPFLRKLRDSATGRL